MKRIDQLLNQITEQDTKPPENVQRIDQQGDSSKKATGKTTSNGINPHFHEFEVDEHGDGITRSVEGEGPDHEHEINGFAVLEGGVDNHPHTITEKPDKLFPDKKEGSKKKKSYESKIDWNNFTGNEQISESRSQAITPGKARPNIDWNKYKRT